MQSYLFPHLPCPCCFPPTPSRIPQKILLQGFLRAEARSPLTNLPWICRPLRRLHSDKLFKYAARRTLGVLARKRVHGYGLMLTVNPSQVRSGSCKTKKNQTLLTVSVHLRVFIRKIVNVQLFHTMRESKIMQSPARCNDSRTTRGLEHHWFCQAPPSHLQYTIASFNS